MSARNTFTTAYSTLFTFTLVALFFLSSPSLAHAAKVVDLDATSLTPGPPATWTNSVGADFTAELDTPSVTLIPSNTGGAMIPAVTLDGTNDWYVGAAANGLGLTGGASRTVKAWVFNPALPTEETVVAWGRRGGGDGTNTSINHATSAAFGAVGHWGGPDIGWNGNEAAGVWQHIAYTWNSADSTTRVYINGALVNSENPITLNTHALDTGSNPLPIVIGNQNEADGTRTDALSGSLSIGKLEIHNTALSGTDILDMFNADAPLFLQGIQPVPEPSAFFMGLLAVAGLAGVMWRRRRTLR